LQGLLF